jgi:hypothetical protein
MKIMSKHDASWATVLGGVITIIGIFAVMIDKTLNFWQIEGNWGSIYNIRYLNAFGSLLEAGQDPIYWGDPYLVAGILILAGGILAIVTGLRGLKTLSVLTSILIVVGLVYFVYVHINYNLIEDIDLTIEISNAFWGSDAALLFTYNWRPGLGFFISGIGGIIALIAAIKMK